MMRRLLAVLLAITPFALGTVRALSTRSDLRMFWMACAALAGTIIVVGIAKLRGRRATPVMIFLAGAILAAVTAYLLGATALPGIVPVAIVLSFCFAASYALATRSRVPAA